MKSINDIMPKVFGAYNFTYNPKENKRIRIDSVKTQYSYRFIYCAGGDCEFVLGDRVYQIEKGDIVFLTPACQYQILPKENAFSITSVFFDFFATQDFSNNFTRCVFLENFDKTLTIKKTEFSDCSLFNDSFVIKNVELDNSFIHLANFSMGQEFAELNGKAELFNVILKLINFPLSQNKKRRQAEKFIRYINQNPCKDLSADALQNIFGYHKNYINALVKEYTGKSLGDCVRNSKINYAKSLIYETDYSLTQIAFELGYFDYSHFYKAFILETGISPKNFAKSQKP